MRFVVAQLAALALCSAHAQTAPSPLTFEVASVKPSPPEVQAWIMKPQSPGSLRLEGVTLMNLIALAYGVREYSILGGPGWVGSERFDIDARAQASSDGGAQAPGRLKSLLAERFELSVQSQTREESVYALVVAKNGPKLPEAKPETRTYIHSWGAIIHGEAATMRLLAVNLASMVGRSVLDKTGLKGRYDFELKWAPEAASAAGLDVPQASDPAATPLFAALQQQLGLRMESQKALVQVLVIDHAARPSPN